MSSDNDGIAGEDAGRNKNSEKPPGGMRGRPWKKAVGVVRDSAVRCEMVVADPTRVG